MNAARSICATARGSCYDDATNTAYDCRCRPQRVARAKARSLSAVIPRRYAMWRSSARR